MRYNSCVKSSRSKIYPQRITKNELFINKYSWKGINFPSEKDDWKKCEKNNRTIALNLMHAKKEKIWFQNITQILKNKLFC